MTITINGSGPVTGSDRAALGANADITSMSALASINGGFMYGNRVINGAQEIDQVNNGAAGTPTGGPATYYGVDMFGAVYYQSAKLTFQQVVDAPSGLKNSTKITVAAQYAPIATDVFQYFTKIEGKDVIDFKLGTAGAATITLSNWIKGSVTGTYAVALFNSAVNRSYVGTVSVTTSWAQVKITLTGDTAGTWPTDNTTGLIIAWDLGCGSNFNTTAGAWQAGAFYRTSGSVTFVNQTAGSTLNITGVDCRLGSTAPAVFERRANELQLAQRYLEKSYNQDTAPGTATVAGTQYTIAASDTAANAGVYLRFSVAKRATPTFLFWNSSGIANVWSYSRSGAAGTATPAASFIGETGGLIYIGVGVPWVPATTDGHWVASARLF